MATLAADLALALDPAQLARRAGVVPDDWQVSVLRSDARQMILCCSRQAGKSTTTAILALHTALFTPGSLVLLLSPSLRQSSELFRKVLDAYRTLDGQPRPEAESVLRLELANGSRLVSLPGSESTVRGFSGVALLIVDEAARVDDALYQAVRPMLAVSGGRLVLLSSPFGKRGFFYREWVDGGPEWQRVAITAHQCPRIDPAWLERERASLPEWIFSQEYLAEFGEAEDAVFRADDITAAFDSGLAPLFGRHL